jgi:hypothetical protein
MLQTELTQRTRSNTEVVRSILCDPLCPLWLISTDAFILDLSHLQQPIVTGRVSFEVAVFLFRGNAPDVYLAQPKGLGTVCVINCRANGPAVI